MDEKNQPPNNNLPGIGKGQSNEAAGDEDGEQGISNGLAGLLLEAEGDSAEFSRGLVGRDISGVVYQLVEGHIEQELIGPSTHGPEQEVGATATAPDIVTENLCLDPELEGGSEFDIIYFDDDGILVKRDLLALNDSQHLQLDLTRWMKNAEQKLGHQQLQPEGESTGAAVYHQDFVPKDTVGTDKLLETKTEEELPGQVSLPNSSAQEVDAGTEPSIGNAVVELSEAQICRCLDNELPGDEDEGYAYTDPGTENGVAELSERELEILRCLIDQEVRYVSVSKDQLEHHCQVCPKHSALLETIEKVKQSLRKAQQKQGEQE